MPRFPLFLAAVFLCLRAGATPFDAFLEEHCYDCHDEQKQKGDLRLDNLPRAFDQGEVVRKWIEVLDRVEAGEMPPKKRTPPPAADRAAFLQRLRTDLLAAETARQKREGRVVLRRLNRTEYQNTLHDLLGMEADLKALLPEDSSAAGFDNVGAALNISTVLMERYLEAADVALDHFLVHGPRPETTKRNVPLLPQRLRNEAGKRDYRLAALRVMGEPGAETMVFFNSGYQPWVLEQFRAPREGRYHFKITGSAFQSADQTLTMAWYGGEFQGAAPNTHLIGHFDFSPDKKTVIEFDDYLPARGTIKPIPSHLGQRQLEKPDEYAGRGIAIESIEVEGPLFDSWPSAAYREMFGELDFANGTLADAEKALRWLLPRAFRRAITEDDVAPYRGLVEAQLAEGKKFEPALRAGLKAVLCAPDFLFLEETPGRLNDDALAARLSYFLWSSLPDDTLRETAARETLHGPESLRAQVERMLADPKAARFTENFTGQWLGLRNIDFTTPDKKLYPEHDDALQAAMVKETHLFFDELLRRDLSIANFISSDFSLLNERLAIHYGIPGVTGQEFRKVKLPPESHRGGVLTQAAILKVSANGTNTSPVVRGNWVLRNLLGKPAKPPPANTPAIEPDIRGAQTIREQIAKHRDTAACAVCHDRMDPPGLALENFDVIGGWRTFYRSVGNGRWLQGTHDPDGRQVQYKEGPSVDASGTLPDGRSFQNIDEFKALLLSQKEQVARCIVEKLITYATGAPPQFADRPAIEGILRKTAPSGYGLRSLVHAVVESEPFLSK